MEIAGEGLRDKAQTLEEAVDRLVPMSLKEHKEADLTGVLEKLQNAFRITTKRNCHCRREGMLPRRYAGERKKTPKESVPSSPPARQLPSGSPWWAESQPQHPKAGMEG